MSKLVRKSGGRKSSKNFKSHEEGKFGNYVGANFLML